MKRVARELGENLSEEELQAMIDEFDRDQVRLIVFGWLSLALPLRSDMIAHLCT